MIQVLNRAADILDLVSGGAHTLTELSRDTGLHKTTVYNILTTLESLGLVARDGEKRYTIGPQLVAWAEPVLRQGTLKRAAEQAATLLNERIRETVHVAILSNRQRLIIARVESKQAVTVNASEVEWRRLYNGCSGPVLLAYLDREELDDIVRYHGLPGDEWDGICSYAALRAALRRIRDDGFFCRLVGDDQAQLLSVPVLGPDSRCWAAICVSLPLSRYVGENRRTVHTEMLSAARGMAQEIAVSCGTLADAVQVH